MTGPAMPSPDAGAVPAMVRTLRLSHGWSQRQLAGYAGLSSSTVSRIERGLRSADNRHVIERLAHALGCPVSDLTGAGPFLRARAGDAASARLRQALVATSLDELAQEVPWQLSSLTAAADQVRVLRDRCAYAAAAWAAADCLAGAHILPGRASRGQRLRVLVRLCFDAAICAHSLGAGATAWIAADRCKAAAAMAGEPALRDGSAYAQARVALCEGAPGQASRLAHAALSGGSGAPRNPDQASAHGMLHLTVALAVVRAKPADAAHADEHLSRAARVASTLAARDMLGSDALGLGFNSATVELFRLVTALEAGDLRAAASAERQIAPADLSLHRQAVYHVTIARLMRELGRHDDAVRSLARTERLAPEALKTLPAGFPLARTLLEENLSAASRRRLRALIERMEWTFPARPGGADGSGGWPC
jgi:transcriptional regulator with XRE-family HTH domain